MHTRTQVHFQTSQLAKRVQVTEKNEGRPQKKFLAETVSVSKTIHQATLPKNSTGKVLKTHQQKSLNQQAFKQNLKVKVRFLAKKK